MPQTVEKSLSREQKRAELATSSRIQCLKKQFPELAGLSEEKADAVIRQLYDLGNFIFEVWKKERGSKIPDGSLFSEEEF